MFSLAEKLFVVLTLFYTTDALLPLFTRGDNPFASTEGNPIALTIQLSLYALTLIFIALRWRTFLQGVLGTRLVGSLAGLAIASAIWSQDPLFTLRKGAALLATTAFGVYFGSRYTVRQQLRLLACAFALVVFASFFIVIFLPQYGIDHSTHAGSWQGAFTQKNVLARQMVLSACVFFFVRFSFGGVFRWLAIICSVALVFLSRSATGMIIFGVMVALAPLYKLLRTRATFAIPVGIGIGVVTAGICLLLNENLPMVFAFLGRDSSLTGRLPLWQAVFTSISKQPFLGYGFNAFWRGMQGESASILTAVQWMPLHSHNAFLDLWLDLGLLGLGTFVLSYFHLCRSAFRYLRSSPGSEPVWLCAFLLLMLLGNMTDGAILTANNIFWVLYTATAVNLSFDAPAKDLTSEAAYGQCAAQVTDCRALGFNY